MVVARVPSRKFNQENLTQDWIPVCEGSDGFEICPNYITMITIIYNNENIYNNSR
jgi:hypothetical protein